MKATNVKRRRVWIQMGMILIGSASVPASAKTTPPPAPSAANPYLYVLEENASQVQVVDTTSNGIPNKTIATIPVGESPAELAILPNNSAIWVPNGGSASITIINTIYGGSSFNTTATISTVYGQDGGSCATVASGPCSYPGALVFNAAGAYAYLVDGGDNMLKVIDVSTGTVVGAVTTTTVENDVPSGVAVNGSTAYVANIISNTLAVIDVTNPASPSLATTIQLPLGSPSSSNCTYTEGKGKKAKTQNYSSGPSPTGLRVAAGYLYVTNAYDDNLFDATQEIEVPPCQTSTVTVIDTATNAVVPGASAISANGYLASSVNFLNGYAFVADTGSDSYPDYHVGVISTSSLTAVGSFTLTSPAEGPAEIDPYAADSLIYIPTTGGPKGGGESITTVSVSNLGSYSIVNTYKLPKKSYPVSLAILP
jgi:YVTN family beta-propeller protein